MTVIFAAVAELCFQDAIVTHTDDHGILVCSEDYWLFLLGCYHFIHKPVNIELDFESTAVT